MSILTKEAKRYVSMYEYLGTTMLYVCTKRHWRSLPAYPPHFSAPQYSLLTQSLAFIRANQLTPTFLFASEGRRRTKTNEGGRVESWLLLLYSEELSVKTLADFVRAGKLSFSDDANFICKFEKSETVAVRMVLR